MIVTVTEFIVPEICFLSDQQCWFEFTEKEFGCIEREIVAHCLVKHVKKIEIKGVEGDEDELRLVKYLLKCCQSFRDHDH